MSVSWRRFDSLFMRLFALQLALVVAVTLLFGLLFYIERNRTVAVLQAQVWAPQLRQALASGVTPADMQRRDDAAGAGLRMAGDTPRVRALRQALLALDVPVREIAFSRAEGGVTTWLRLAPSAGPVRWYGLRGPLVAPRWPRRMLLALLLVGGLLGWACWVFTRRLTQPLERLRDQLRAGVAGSQTGGDSPPEIAEIEAAHAELLRKLQRQQSERALLLAGVSHDLRSPLARIRMAVALMPEHEDTAARRASIVRNVQAADCLIESFVDFVRTGELPLDETVDLATLLRRIVAGCERPADELSLTAPDELLLDRAHPLLIERLVSNLIDNAFKHGRPPVALRLEVAQGQVLLEVADAGPGIAPAQREALQQAFARGDASRNVAGAGLGLAIARQVVARLGGRLDFQIRSSGHAVMISLPMPAAPYPRDAVARTR